RLDRPTAPQGQATPFPLKRASAARVATLITNFYAQRYPGETAAQHLIRVTEDDSPNTVFIQAAPADLAEIRGLITYIETHDSISTNDFRIVPLKYALADELTALLQQAISQGIAVPSATGTSTGIPTTPGQPGAFGAPGATPGQGTPAFG